MSKVKVTRADIRLGGLADAPGSTTSVESIF